MLLLVCFIFSTAGQTLFYEAFVDNTFTTAQDWTIVGGTGIVSTCAGTRLLGGYGVFGKQAKVMKLLQLPPHYSMQISFEMYKLNSWDNEKFYFYVDQDQCYMGVFGGTGTNICGSGNNVIVTTITETITHNSQSTLIYLTSNLDEVATNVYRVYMQESWGIREFKLYLYLCPPGCQTCDSSDTREDCIPWTIIDSNFLLLIRNDEEGWIIENGSKKTTDCSCTQYFEIGVPLLGGVSETAKNSYFIKTIKLPPHDKIKIKFRFAFLDSWDGEQGQLYIDGTLQWFQSYAWSGQLYNICGQGYSDLLTNQIITITHSEQQVMIKVTTTLDQDPNDESFGFRDFELFICNLFTQLDCKFGDSYSQACGQFCGDGVIQGNEECDDDNIYPFDGCFNCQYSCVEGCSNCINGKCYECIDGWQYNYQFNICEPIINDQIIKLNEICDDNLQQGVCLNGQFIIIDDCQLNLFGICQQCNLDYQLIDNKCEPICSSLVLVNQIECNDNNLNPNDQCNQCQYDIYEGCQQIKGNQCLQCQNGWYLNKDQNKCIPICGDSITNGNEECDIQNNNECSYCQFKCQDECIDCQYGKCYDCIEGWKVNIFKCVTVCGNKIVSGVEVCDDGNQIQLDGCYDCNNNCQTECDVCEKGKCINCIYGWKLNDKGICETECGDNQFAIFSLEQCDDGNFLSNDGCFDCKIECCPECSACMFGICYECSYTYHLIEQYCLPICGDGLISIGYEQCDDMNYLPYDGCYDCQYQCRLHCKNCIKGICYDACQYGYVMIDYDCQSVCGDKIIIDNEECDDGNSIQFDGCHQCFYSCPNHCQICNEGQCYQCDQGYLLYYSENYCEPGCGDGHVAIDQEQCDDGNNDNNDGCSNKCLIEKDFVCKNTDYSFSECTYEKYPEFKATFIEQKYQYQYVSLTFTQQVKTIKKDIFSNYIELQLSGVQPECFTLNLQIIQEATDNVMDVQYMVEIFINETLSQPPTLKVILNDQLYNSNEAPLLNLVDEVTLRFPKFMNEQQKQLSVKLQNASENMISSLGGIGILVVLLGNSFLLWGMLELLQQQSYLRFINVVFPENLFIYFETSNIISLQPVLNFVHYNSLFNTVIEIPFLESYEKFKFYGINADILTNLQTQVFIVITMYLTYLSAKYILKSINKIGYHYFYRCGFHISKALFNVKNSILVYWIKIRQEGVQQMLISNTWDLFFISLLQIRSTNFNTPRMNISFSLALLIIYIATILSSDLINTRSIKRVNFTKYWAERSYLFITFKKFLFIAILVLFQLNQQIQTILLSSIGLIFIIYVIVFKPVGDNVEFAKLFIMEITTLIFIFTQFLYWKACENYFDYNQQILFGWFHISLLLCTLFVNIILQVWAIMKEFIQRHVKKQQIQKMKSHEQVANPFPLQFANEQKT